MACRSLRAASRVMYGPSLTTPRRRRTATSAVVRGRPLVRPIGVRAMDGRDEGEERPTSGKYRRV
eukprot:scaffold202968_cov35-Tisochrysis_lutea.AAC.1